MQHVEQAVAKLELLLRAAMLANCDEQCTILRLAQTVMISALLEQKAPPTIDPTQRFRSLDVFLPVRRQVECVTRDDT